MALPSPKMGTPQAWAEGPSAASQNGRLDGSCRFDKLTVVDRSRACRGTPASRDLKDRDPELLDDEAVESEHAAGVAV